MFLLLVLLLALVPFTSAVPALVPYGQLFTALGVLTPVGLALLGNIHPTVDVQNQLSFVGHVINPANLAALVGTIGPVVPNMDNGYYFCWRCARRIPTGHEWKDPLIFIWVWWSAVPLLMHLRCAYYQLSANGHEAFTFAYRGLTRAHAHFQCNLRGAVNNYPEARIFQKLQMTMDIANVSVFLLSFPVVLIGGGEFAYEADFFITAKYFIINPMTHLTNYLPDAAPIFACGQIKNFHFIKDTSKEGAVSISGTIRMEHHYSVFTLIVVQMLHPVTGVVVYFCLNGLQLQNMCAPGTVAIPTMPAADVSRIFVVVFFLIFSSFASFKKHICCYIIHSYILTFFFSLLFFFYSF